MKARDIDREFAEFYRSEKGWLARAAYLMVGDAQAAQDLLQDALVNGSHRRLVRGPHGV